MADPNYGTTSTASGSSGERIPFSSIPKRWPLVTTNQHRSAETSQINKDARLVNCYAELEPTTGDYNVEKRPGYGDPILIPPAATGGGGIYSWAFVIYSVFNNKLYNGITATIGTINNQAAYVFTEGQAAGAPLVLHNGRRGYYTDGITATQIPDPDFPIDAAKGIVYLDGTFYVMRADGGIQGSAIDDITTWDPLNLIFARSAPGNGICLIKHLTYVVALKNTSTEAFYDAGNLTGSPLARVDGAFIPMGCAGADTVAEIDGIHFWAGVRSGTSGYSQLVRLENLQLTVISTPPVERVLTKLLASGGSVRAYVLKLGGHRLYVITSLTYPFALVYDIDQKLFYQWFKEDEAIWPFVGCASGTVSAFNTGTYSQHYLTGKLYKTDTDFVYPMDDGVLIPVDIYTPNVDFGIRRTKQLNAMLFNSDQVAGSFLYVRSSDNDYEKWTNFRRVNLGIKQPLLSGLGSFFKRAYHFRHRGRTSFGIQCVDLQMDIGTF